MRFLLALLLVFPALGQISLSDPGFIASLTAPAAGGSPTFPANCVAYWKFDEGTPTFADFFTGNDFVSTTFDPASAAGIIGNCGDYTPGAFDHVSASDGADLDFGSNIDGSISLWLRPDTVTAFNYVLGKDAGGMGYTILISDAGKVRLNIVGTDPFESAGSLTVSTWAHIVFTYDQSNVRIYINGSLDSTIPNTVDWPSNSDALEVGRSAGAGVYYDGRVDEMGIWKRALTDQEASDLYNGGTGLQP